MNIGIVFDLDGTLLNTLEDLLDATNYALRLHGYPERTLAELRRFVGNGARNQIRLSLPRGASDGEIDAVLASYKPYYTAHCQEKTRPYDGILPALEALNGQFPIAIVSNKPDPAVKALCENYFPGIYALGETPDCPRKPAPDMIFRALAAIGAERGICVGDSEVDVRTADNARMPVLSVLWGFRDRADIQAAGGRHFCPAPEEMPGELRKLAQATWGA